MAKKKGISISLAAKCQMLFGLAVLVIIAGALAVPWQRMEQLAGQPNIKAARFAADLLFRQIHNSPIPSVKNIVAAVTAASQSAATTAPAVEWNDVTLSDMEYTQPRIHKVLAPTENLPLLDGGNDDVAAQALTLFRARAQETEYGRAAYVTDSSGGKMRVYKYAAAIRLDASCLKCHTEYVGWVKNPAAIEPRTIAPLSSPETSSASPPATAPASLQVPSLPSEKPSETAASLAAWPIVGVIRVDVPYQTDENQLLLNRIVIVVSGMLGGTLAIVVFYLITNRLILQPVRVLKNTAEKVAQGDLNIRSAISTGDEFQHLSETFNTMLATLKGSQDQLESTNRSLDTRVGELAQSNVDLFEANRLKSEFLTNVTHELRTPLNAIIGFADLMGETAKAGGDARQQRYSENIRISAKQLLDLINDLLDLAKIEAGKLVLREEKMNVADVCEAMANFIRPLAQKKNIELGLSIAPDMPLITTDPGRFQQILYNFLSNAIKFTPAEGKVSIRARNEPLPDAAPGAEPSALVPSDTGQAAAVRIDISDSGPGISDEDQKVIFEKFRQIDGSVTRQHSGTGLGLAISRELAHMLGSRIELASAPGKGAVFSLIVPAENPHRTSETHPILENR